MEIPDFLRIVTQLRRQGSDDGRIEAKACTTKLATSVWATVSAFANTQGGLIILGLAEEQNFEVVPDFPLAQVRDQFVDGMGDANRTGAKLTNPPQYHLHRGEIDGKPVLGITIVANLPGHRPCFVTTKGLSGGSYRRVGDKDVRLTSTEVHQMHSEVTPQASDREPIPESSPADLDQSTVQALLAVTASSRATHGATTDVERLTRLNVTTAHGVLRRAGLLVCGQYPQQFLPQHIIDVAVHPARQKAAAHDAVRFVDRTLCDGPLAVMVQDSIQAVARNLRTRSVVAGAHRRDELEVPEVVLREAIANAVLHRELDPLFDGQSVTVDVFPDRIEVRSPGGLWGGATIANLGDGVSRCRNATLLRLLMHQAGRAAEGTVIAAVEGQGSGVPLMQHQMAQAGLAPPLFTATPDSLTVTLFREPVSPVGEPTSAADCPIAQLRQQHREVLAELSLDVPLSLAEIAVATGRSVGALRHVMRELVEADLVTATAPPTSKNRRYLLSS